ncbi:receptor like protein 43 [Striga asiatica]|uniref:Receptor like protein 43 n=1 Tax=Striga asiatica TaxID=4170 RepID=A0A5A7Q1S6_STRAF|nr:receptor like protein 43 [Striga asiatica]
MLLFSPTFIEGRFESPLHICATLRVAFGLLAYPAHSNSEKNSSLAHFAYATKRSSLLACLARTCQQHFHKYVLSSENLHSNQVFRNKHCKKIPPAVTSKRNDLGHQSKESLVAFPLHGKFPYLIKGKGRTRFRWASRLLSLRYAP